MHYKSKTSGENTSLWVPVIWIFAEPSTEWLIYSLSRYFLFLMGLTSLQIDHVFPQNKASTLHPCCTPAFSSFFTNTSPTLYKNIWLYYLIWSYHNSFMEIFFCDNLVPLKIGHSCLTPRLCFFKCFYLDFQLYSRFSHTELGLWSLGQDTLLQTPSALQLTWMAPLSKSVASMLPSEMATSAFPS